MKYWLFFRTRYSKNFFALHSNCTGEIQWRVWFDLEKSLTRWKRIILKIRKNSHFAKSAKFRMKTQIFPRQAIPKVLFDLHSYYIGDTPYRVWSDLDNSLTRWRRPIFKTPFLRNSKSSVWNTNFFPWQAGPIFLLYTLITLVILYTKFGLIWKTAWPDEKELFLNFSKIRNSRNSQKSVWKPKVFPRRAIPNVLFALHSHYIGDTPYRVWFDLDNSLTRWKRPLFKILFSRNSKSSVWNTNFFPRQAVPIFFVLLYTLITLVILHAEIGLIWTTA